jgi:hypothetical protein
LALFFLAADIRPHRAPAAGLPATRRCANVRA